MSADAVNVVEEVSPLAIMAGLPTASKYQVDIFEAVRDAVAKRTLGETPNGIVVKAVAGAGKTTTIVACTRLIPATWKVLFLAFNTRVAEDLRGKLPRHVECNTLNGRGWKVWSRYIEGRDRVKPDLVQSKLAKVIREVLNKEQREVYGEAVRFLTNMARVFGVVPRDAANCVSLDGVADNDAFWNAVISVYDYDAITPDMLGPVLVLVRQVLTKMLYDEQNCDFDDQVYLPVVKRTAAGLPIPAFQYDAVIVDEAQDINPVQRALIRMVLKRNGLLIAVGDERQAIYGFRGADVNSINKIKTEFNAIEKPLTISYRCAASIVRRARAVYPEIEAAPGAAEGEVVYHKKYTLDLFQPGDLIICRNNAPLVSLAYKLLKARKPCKVVGRDIGEGIIRIIAKISQPTDNMETLIRNLLEWQAGQIAVIKAKDEDDEEAIQKINDRFETIMVFAQESANKTVGQLIDDVRALFADNDTNSDTKIVLGTVHKMKGGEANRVFFLDFSLMYPRWIEKDTWQFTQERNLEYVGVTRAKFYLGFIASEYLVY